jgi:hypothetical protein
MCLLVFSVVVGFSNLHRKQLGVIICGQGKKSLEIRFDHVHGVTILCFIPELKQYMKRV